MNISDLTYLLNKPETINEKQTIALEHIVLQYPYFQSVRALHLKGLYNQKSFRYNYELKKTAAYTSDRTILFEFITSDNFTTIEQEKVNEITKSIFEIDLNYSQEIAFLAKNEIVVPTDETNEIETINKTTEEKLEIGKPLPFTPNERHSFQEWLQLTKINIIERNEDENKNEIDETKLKKIELIDKFIESNPKIIPAKEFGKPPVNISKSIEEPTHLMTETLAKVYLEQKKYTKAIQAYEILILKYPENSSFFADRINEIKNLQQNNN